MKSSHGGQQFREQRSHARVKVSIYIDWEVGGKSRYRDRITSLSAGGCFIQTHVRALRGQSVQVRLWLSPGEESVLRGQVVYNLENVGLGIEFTGLSENERERIQELVNHYL